MQPFTRLTGIAAPLLRDDVNTDQILAQMRTGQANSQLPSDVTQQGVIVQPGTTAPLTTVS